MVVEVASPDEALDWAHAGADVIQAEKFTPDAIGATAQRLALLAAANFSDVSRAVLHSGSRGWQSQPWTAHTCETDGPPYRIDYALVRPGTPSLTRCEPVL